mgnify:CR=1 FL=1
MSKYTAGTYLIKGFDRIGTKVFTKKAEKQHLIGAQHEGISLVNEGKCASFVILRVMINSAMRGKENWE